MPIKAQYTIRPGDRITRIAANYGITVQEILDNNPQIFTADRIDKSNKLIAVGTINNGEYLIYTGEILNIPSGELDDLTDEQTIRVDADDELTILIDGVKCPLPHEFSFTEYFDACSDSFSLTYPYEPSLANPAFDIDIDDLKTKGLPKQRIYIGEDPVLSGNIEVPAYSIDPSASVITLAGRSATFLLEKSDVYPSIPREFLNLTLDKIAPQITRPYGIGVEIADNVDLSEPFEKATIEDNEKPFFFLSKLARERQCLLGCTASGKLLIHKAVQSEPVAHFKIESSGNNLGVRTGGEFYEFIGVQSLDFTFDTTQLYGQYIGKTSTPDDQNLVETVQSKVLLQQSVNIKEISEATAKTLPDITAWEEQKAVREFYKNAIPFPDWLNPNTGTRWKTGEFVTLEAPESGIPKPKLMMIRSIQFTKNSEDKRIAVLNLIPAEVYL